MSFIRPRTSIGLFILTFIYLLFLVTACGQEKANTVQTNLTAVSVVNTTVTTTNNLTTISTTPTPNSTYDPFRVTYTPLATAILPRGDLQNSDYRWLFNIPCKLPCWESITAGQTKREEVLKALQQNPFVAKIEANSSVQDQITFNWSNKAQSQNDGKVWFDENSIVESIVPGESISLGQIIGYFGKPKYVSAYKDYQPEAANYKHSSFSYQVNLFYPELGLFLTSFDYQRVDVTDTLVVSPTFLKQNFDPAKELKSQQAAILPWQGYNNFNFYCRQFYLKDQPCTDDQLLP